MILPNKHTTLSNSILNLGAVLLENITDKQTVTILWDKSRIQPEIRNFERFTLGLDLLFSMGLIEFNEGLIVKVRK